MSDWNAEVIAEFRANGGKVERFADAPIVILNTIGAKSGQLREIPLVAMVDDDAIVIFASKAGAPSNPDWYYNLKANPEIDVEFGTEMFRARIDQLPADEAAAKIQTMAGFMPQFAEYVEKAAPRAIPAFGINRLG